MKNKPRKPRRGQQMTNMATGGEIRGSTERTTFPGKKGDGGLDSLTKLAKGMVVENQERENLEEQKLFTISNDVKTLLESLIREDEHETQ
jgi:hypothetical protein